MWAARRRMSVGAGLGWLAAATVAALCLGVAAFATACEDDEPEPRPGLWVALVRPPGDPSSQEPLRVFDPRTGEELLRTESGFWAGPRFSPDARYLVAFSIRPEPELRVFDLAEGRSTARQVDLIAEAAAGPSWAPDSSLIAFAGRERLTLLTPRGRVQAQLAMPASTGDSWGGSADVVWSTDSRYFALSFNGRLIVGDRDGRQLASLQGQDVPGGDESFRVQMGEWLDSDSLLVLTGKPPANPPTFFALTIDGGGYRWDQLTAAQLPPYIDDYAADRAEVEALLPGASVRSGGKTADGSAQVWQFIEQQPGATTRFALAVGNPGSYQRLDLPDADPPDRRSTYDVVIVGGQ